MAASIKSGGLIKTGFSFNGVVPKLSSGFRKNVLILRSLGKGAMDK